MQVEVHRAVGMGPGLLSGLEAGNGRVVGGLRLRRRDVPLAVIAVRVRCGVLLRDRCGSARELHGKGVDSLLTQE